MQQQQQASTHHVACTHATRRGERCNTPTRQPEKLLSPNRLAPTAVVREVGVAFAQEKARSSVRYPPTCRTYTECISFALWMLRSLGLGSAAVKQAMPSNAFLCNVKKIAFCCSVVIYNFLPTPNGRCSRARPHSYVFVKT